MHRKKYLIECMESESATITNSGENKMRLAFKIFKKRRGFKPFGWKPLFGKRFTKYTLIWIIYVWSYILSYCLFDFNNIDGTTLWNFLH